MWVGAIAAACSLVAGGSGAAEAATRWVAKDGKAGPSSCSGTRNAAKTIQAAVTASAAGDTVVVCPGTYRERIVIGGTRNDLTVRSSTVGGAIIRSPASLNNILTITGVEDAVVSGFKIQVDTAAPCTRQIP
jgi:polygalacturonase